MLLKDIFEKKHAMKTKSTAWVILYTEDKVILGKRSPSTNNPNQWNFFGGGIDVGESPKEAAIRELKEETGYEIESSALKEITKLGAATYFAAKIINPSKVGTTDEVSKVKGYKLTELPDNLHAKTENFFSRLDNLFS